MKQTKIDNYPRRKKKLSQENIEVISVQSNTEEQFSQHYVVEDILPVPSI